ncbi:MAG TPA: hypothetical protein VE130_13890 [Nitrososphaeraceae archaeon]|nr:hypothetical protein [Nitrososphaeraceae archaeon]
MPLTPEERDKRLQSLNETIDQNLDEQIQEHKDSARFSLALYFDRELPLLKNVLKVEIFRRQSSIVSGQIHSCQI